MTYELYVTKDVVKGRMEEPIYFRNNENEAKRAWGNAIKQVRQNNPDNIPIDDLQLWKIGEIDVNTLIITPGEKFICSGSEF